MTLPRDNPDRNFTPGPISEVEAQELRTLLKSRVLAETDDTFRSRVGKIISRAAFTPTKQWRRLD